MLASLATRSPGQASGWIASLVFHAAVLAALVWAPPGVFVQAKLAGNPKVVTLVCSQASVASPPQSLEVVIPLPEEEAPVEPPPPPVETPALPEPKPPKVPVQDSLEVLHALARHQVSRQQAPQMRSPRPRKAPVRKLLAQAELARVVESPATEQTAAPAPSPTRPPAAVPPRKEQTPPREQKPVSRPVRLARQRRLPSPATRAAPLADAVGTEQTKAPRRVYTPEPPYPEVFPRPTGKVILRLLIGTDGRVQRAEVYKSSGHAVLDRVARQTALRHWVWEPARRGGRPVPAYILVAINFVDD